MAWRIAVASMDGKVINEHFGRAKSFYIVDINSDGTSEYAGARDIVPVCSGGEHSSMVLEDAVRAISDCDAILVAKIGAAPKRLLEMNHIAVFEQPDYIDNAIEKLTKYFIKTNMKQNDIIGG